MVAFSFLLKQDLISQIGCSVGRGQEGIPVRQVNNRASQSAGSVDIRPSLRKISFKSVPIKVLTA